MIKIFVSLLLFTGVAINPGWTETTVSHCTSNETILFSCVLKNQKIVSLCSTQKSPEDSGYIQYRFGANRRIELLIPKKRAGIPDLALVHNKTKYLEYNKVAIINEPFTYNIESFRQFKKTNPDGYPNTKSSDTLTIEDSRKSVWEGNKIYRSECATLENPVDAEAISELTGIDLE